MPRQSALLFPVCLSRLRGHSPPIADIDLGFSAPLTNRATRNILREAEGNLLKTNPLTFGSFQ